MNHEAIVPRHAKPHRPMLKENESFVLRPAGRMSSGLNSDLTLLEEVGTTSKEPVTAQGDHAHDDAGNLGTAKVASREAVLRFSLTRRCMLTL